MPLPTVRHYELNPVEPMQVDLPDTDAPVDENFTVESPTLDLDAYSANYKGFTKIQRLLFIAKHCPLFELDALRLVAGNLKKTHNVDLYKTVMKNYAEARERHRDDSTPECQGEAMDVDQQWLETMTKRAQVKLEKLEQDLKYYKNNSIKESIRRGHDDLGDHYLDCGDHNNALKCYSRARDYCISSKHVINMCLNVIKVSVYLTNWAHVQTYVTKAEAVPDLSEQKEQGNNQVVLTKLKCVAGLAALSSKQYKSAARLFLQACFDHCDYSEVISAHDVAIYGGLCALATFDREELQRKVLSSSSFKQFLELEPQLRDTLHKFYDSKYAFCLDLLQNMKDNLMLDIYLSPHVSKLYTEIRNRALIQYFSPYVSADLHKMANAFNTSVADLEDELTQLILDGLISARIDSQNKVLYAREVDQRSTTFEKALSMGQEYQRRTKALILRTVIIKNQVTVKSPPRDDEAGVR